MEELNGKAAVEGFWQDNEAAQLVLKERSRLEGIVDTIERLVAEAAAFGESVALAEELADPALAGELEQQAGDLDRRVEEIETTRLLGGRHDRSNAFIQFAPGAGGIDSADWAEMLVRMIARFAERKGFEVQEVDL
ncbi:MAG TPA: PCRF domain-containing protein, partial [Polyangia bacterium]|nr:PCRF domain-containing protein [Polyangia bacterium]